LPENYTADTPSLPLPDLPEMAGNGHAEPTLPPAVVDLIGEGLRSYYVRLMDEPMPDRLLELVRSLEAQGRASDDG